jgi:ribonuclease D
MLTPEDTEPNASEPGRPDRRAEEPITPPVPVITEPRWPVDGPITSVVDLDRAADRLGAGTGPVAVDAERASGYRYSQRAYLIQLWRAGADTVLIDPIAFDDLTVINEALAGVEWVLHAASQDLSCLRDVGMNPHRLFDTEVAGRILGLERVSLSLMLEHFLGVSLVKGHSAADWSTRPLPADWLNYAALDVDLLIELRDSVATALDESGKREWAEQEFAATLAAPAAPPRIDPWRRTSGIHALRSRRQLAAVRSLWEARDEIASARDIAPGRILPDSAIVAAVRANPSTSTALAELPVFRGPRQRRHAGRWFQALNEARALADTDLPTSAGRGDAIPAPSRWREREPAAAARLSAVRDAIASLADQHQVQLQNLLAADVIRRLCWTPPTTIDEAAVSNTLAELGARAWQIELTVPAIASALQDAAVSLASGGPSESISSDSTETSSPRP